MIGYGYIYHKGLLWILGGHTHIYSPLKYVRYTSIIKIKLTKYIRNT